MRNHTERDFPVLYYDTEGSWKFHADPTVEDVEMCHALLQSMLLRREDELRASVVRRIPGPIELVSIIVGKRRGRWSEAGVEIVYLRQSPWPQPNDRGAL